jgi:K+-sensing histidine kinase KdpD
MMPIIFNNQKAVVIAMIDITVERIFINELNSKVDDLRRQHNDSEYQIKASKEIADYLRHMNDSLNREKNKLKMLFDNMTSGFLVVQRQNGNLYFQEGNTILTEIFNIDVDKYIGQKISDDTILNNKKFHNAIINVLDTGHSTSFPISFDSSNKTYQVNMYMPENETVAVLINDITDEMESHRNIKELSFKLKKQNIDLDNKNYALQKAIETKNKFMSIIAHDLRNPFNAINGLSDLLAHRLSSADDKKSYEIAQLINQSAKKHIRTTQQPINMGTFSTKHNRICPRNTQRTQIGYRNIIRNPSSSRQKARDAYRCYRTQRHNICR